MKHLLAFSLLLLASLSRADTLDLSTTILYGSHGTQSFTQFKPLGPTVGINFYQNQLDFIVQLPSGFTQGTMSWDLSVGGVLYSNSITATNVLNFNQFLLNSSLGCPSVLTSTGLLGSVCGSTGFAIGPFSGALPANLTLEFFDLNGNFEGSVTKNFLVTVPEPSTYTLFVLGLLLTVMAIGLRHADVKLRQL